MMRKYLTEKDVIYQLSNLKQITFEVTDACNLKCTYCGYGEFYFDYDKRENIELSFEKAVRLIDYLIKFWNSEYNVSFKRNVYISFYGGEPLLNMGFIKKVVEYLEKADPINRHFTFSMTTNAILLNKHMNYLVDKNFNLLISLDGNEKNSSYRIDKSNNPAFERIVKNINSLKLKYPLFFEQNVNFNAVLHNKNSVGEIYSFFKEKYNKIPSIGELNDMGIRPEMKNKFMETYRNSYESLRQSENYTKIEKDMFINSGTYQTVITYLHRHTNFVYKDYNELIYGKETKKRFPTGTCLPFGKKMFITVNGKILPCERIGHQFALGNISDTNIELDFESIADRYNKYFEKLEKQCSSCYNSKTCTQCIFNLEDIDSIPICYGYMNKHDFEIYEARQMHFLQRNPEEYYRIMENVIIEQ